MDDNWKTFGNIGVKPPNMGPPAEGPGRGAARRGATAAAAVGPGGGGGG